MNALLIQRPLDEPRFISTDKELGRLLSAKMPERLFRWIIIQMAPAGRPQTAIDLAPAMRDREARLVHLNPPDRRQNKRFRATVGVIGVEERAAFG